MRAAVAVLVFATLAACARTSLTPVGDRQYAPLTSEHGVTVYAAEGDVREAFTVIALVTYVSPGKYQLLTLEDAMPELKEKARAAGANGLIIDDASPVRSGLISTGISVRARAIRVGE